MKLNAGSGGISRGRYKKSEWINLDFNPRGQIEVCADMAYLPFDADSFDEIHLVHVFEHIRRPLQLPVLREMYRVLEPGGTLFIEVPDFKSTIQLLIKGWSKPDDENYQQLAHNMTASLYGKQRYDGDQHCWAFTVESMHEMLVGALDHKWSSLEVLGRNHAISDHWKHEHVLLFRAIK